MQDEGELRGKETGLSADSFCEEGEVLLRLTERGGRELPLDDAIHS